MQREREISFRCLCFHLLTLRSLVSWERYRATVIGSVTSTKHVTSSVCVCVHACTNVHNLRRIRKLRHTGFNAFGVITNAGTHTVQCSSLTEAAGVRFSLYVLRKAFAGLLQTFDYRVHNTEFTSIPPQLVGKPAACGRKHMYKRGNW